jgi:Fic family protein
VRSFQRTETLDPVPSAVVRTLRRIDQAAGAESRFADQLPQLLDALRARARIESITASSAIEGVLVDEARIPKLLSGEPARFRDRSEAEYAGYRAALDYLNQDDPGELSVGLILHLHRLLFSFADGRGGHLKTEDNLVVDRHRDGTRSVRFRPVSAKETPFYVEELVARGSNAIARGEHHPLIVTAAFALDLLCIHPFGDGNGRVARLITGYLMQRTGYGVGRYVSLEQLIFDTKDDYYGSLGASTNGRFDDAHHDPWPWTRYLLDRVDEAYVRLADRVAAGTSPGTKQDRVRDHILLRAPLTFAIADIRRAVPGVSDNTIRLVLAALKAEGHIANDGTGRSATWHRTDPSIRR